MKKRSGSTATSGTTTPKIEYYKPGEEPRPKYRGTVSKEHTEKLQSFSFSDAWKDKESGRKSSASSVHGLMSPGGTVAQSRATSFVASLRKKSIASGSESDTDGRDARRKSVAIQPETGTVKENPLDDTNVTNAGGPSRPQTAAGKPPDPANTSGVPLEKTATNGEIIPPHNVPFSSEELQKALSRATIEAPNGVARGGEIAAY